MKRIFLMNLLAGIIGGIITLTVFLYVDKDPAKKTTLHKPILAEENIDTPKQIVRMGASPVAYTDDFVSAANLSVDAVVHVRTAYMRSYSTGNPFLDYFFGNGSTRQQQPVLGSGSGVIISDDGYIITNNHVIENAEQIRVALNDNREFDAELIGTDPGTDIALLKIDTDDLTFLKPGNSEKVQIGEWVLAVGNPFNLTSTVTAGIVSAKARNINLLRSNYGIEAFIQTDAAVNPGNSGGALVNSKGELIGINTAIASKTGSFSGYSFAVPINIAMKVVDDLIEFGEVQRAVLGVVIHDLSESFAEENNIETLAGVYVERTEEGGAAAKADIQNGDVIIRVGSVDVKNVAELQEQLSRFRPGDNVTITVLRGNSESEKQVVLQNRLGNTEIIASSDDLQLLGATFESVSNKEKRLLRIAHGLKVVDLQSGKFRSAGIQEGFIVLYMNGTKIVDIQDISGVLNNADGGIMVEGIYPNGMKAYYAFGN